MTSNFLKSLCVTHIMFSCLGVAFFAASAWKSPPTLVAGQPEPSQTNSSPAAEAEANNKLFVQHCAKCHGANGKGSTPARKLYPEMPDFCDANWQKQHTDAQLLSSILRGKGDGMPGFRDKISREQAQGLATYVRKFSRSKGEKKEGGPESFEKELRTLQKQFEVLQRMVEELWREAVDNSGPPGYYR